MFVEACKFCVWISFNLFSFVFQLSKSDARKVIITKVDFSVAGKVSCEVTTDSSPIETKTVEQPLIVVGEFNLFFLIC